MGQFGNIPSCQHAFKYNALLSLVGAKAVPKEFASNLAKKGRVPTSL